MSFFPLLLAEAHRGLLVLGSTLVIASPLRVVSLSPSPISLSPSVFFSTFFAGRAQRFDKPVAKKKGGGVGRERFMSVDVPLWN